MAFSNFIDSLGTGLKLPEFGLSEALNYGNRTQNTGITTQSQNAGFAYNPANPQSVSGAQQTPANTYNLNNPFMSQGTLGSATSSTSGGAGGGAVAGGGGSAVQSSGPNPFDQLINDAYNSTIGFLDQAEGNLRGQQGGIEAGIQGQYNTSKGNLTSERDLSSGEIDSSQQGGEKRQEDALSAARRLFNDLSMGGQQRYGGASSAGEAYQALAGKELMRNRQQITSDFSNFMGQITQARTGLQTRFQQAISTLEQKKNDALGQAQRDFQDRLLSIGQQKAQAAGQKAQQQLAALQDLRNQVFQINLANVSGTDSVNKLREQSEAELASAEQAFTQQQNNAGQAQQGYNQQASVDPVTGLPLQQQAQGQEMAFQGQIQGQPEDEDLFGKQVFA